VKKKRALNASRAPEYPGNWAEYTFRDPDREPSAVIINCGDVEHIRLTKTGFFVRGIAVKQDDREAEIVYNAFREFLTYHALTRNY